MILYRYARSNNPIAKKDASKFIIAGLSKPILQQALCHTIIGRLWLELRMIKDGNAAERKIYLMEKLCGTAFGNNA